MGNEEIGELLFLLQILQEVDHLGLDGNIEGGNRFIGDDEFRFHRQGAGNADPLTLSTTEFMRISLGVLRLQADLFKELIHPFLTGFPPRQPMGINPLGNDIPYPHAGVQGGVGILKDHLDLPVGPLLLFLIELGHIATVIMNRS